MADPRGPTPAPGDEPRRDGETGIQPVSDPGELLRIGSMVGSLLEEAHNSALDDAGRRRLAEVYRRAVDAVRHAVSPELGGELTELGFSLDGLASSESELRLAQAQLVGWLNGLLLGLQAAAINQLRVEEADPLTERNREPLGARRAGGGYA